MGTECKLEKTTPFGKNPDMPILIEKECFYGNPGVLKTLYSL